MLYSGVSWDADGFGVEVLDDDRIRSQSARFRTDESDRLIAFLAGFSSPSVTVVDSTNGMLDGRMMAAGLTVYRADPDVLSERPPLGSVPALELARTAQTRLSRLTRLQPDRGTQTDREDVLAADIAASAMVLGELVAQGRCVSRGPDDRPVVALTFDDGPNPPYTGQILDILERYGVPATFFCVGLNVSGGREDIARISEQGHGLGNHTWSHPFLPELSRAQLVSQIDATGRAIAGASGVGAPTLFRPPYGSRSPEVLDWLSSLTSTIVLWDVEPFDWAMPGADVIASIVVERTRPGSIILLHDGGGDRSQTVAALPPIIEGLLAQGYQFVSVEQMLTAAPARAGASVGPLNHRA